MHDNDAGQAEAGPPRELALGAPVVLLRAHVDIQLKAYRGTPFLAVRSRIDPSQSFLLPARHRPTLSGLSVHTRLKRIHALYWGLAYGFGDLGQDAVVRFEPDPRRGGRRVDVAPQSLGHHYWVADAEGIFSSVAMLVGEQEAGRTQLADHW